MTRRHRLEVGIEAFAMQGWHPDREGSNHQAVTIDIPPECTTSRADIWLWCTFPEVCRRVPARTTRTASRPWERARRRVGANIVALRTERGLTQEALALRSGISRNVLIDVERGRRGLLYERLFDLAEALDVSVAALLQEQRGAGG